MRDPSGREVLRTSSTMRDALAAAARRKASPLVQQALDADRAGYRKVPAWTVNKGGRA